MNQTPQPANHTDIALGGWIRLGTGIWVCIFAVVLDTSDSPDNSNSNSVAPFIPTKLSPKQADATVLILPDAPTTHLFLFHTN